MPARKIPEALVSEACDLRERGWSFGKIAQSFKARGHQISASAISWHCLINGADLPQARRSSHRPKPGRVVIRNGHTVRTFTPEEDQMILRMEGEGARYSEIARQLNRGRNSIVGRLATLARQQARLED